MARTACPPAPDDRDMTLPRLLATPPWRRLPAVVLNGMAVALGIGCIQWAVAALGGSPAAQLALSGAVCTSLADVPGTVSRSARRLAVAAALGFLSALAVDLLRAQPMALGLAIAVIAFVAMMAMAWGPRAGAVSFVPILSLVFAMALPPHSAPLVVLAWWHAAGAAAYLAWALLMSHCLQRRYRTLALCGALNAAVALLRARAELLCTVPADAGHAGAVRTWLRSEADLAERLQTARDFVFDQRPSDAATADVAVLLRLIDLRDVLLASRLDLELLGQDVAARHLLQRVAEHLRAIAAALHAGAAALRDGQAPAAWTPVDATGLARTVVLADGDARARLLLALGHRLDHLGDGAARILALLRGGQGAQAGAGPAASPAPPPLTHAQLQRFVSPKGWPWQALRAHWHGQSPVLRHAVRSALALGAAYFIALGLPWGSHPHWLVLGVAVVLRGSLEQTLARRNARVLGTLLGCGVVIALSGVHSAAVLALVFLLSVAIAHSFVLHRYWLTATAATVMALLQSHMANPAAGFAVAERVADTLLGALLAWAFSYVLPAWERRSLPGAIQRVLADLADYAGQALTMPPPGQGAASTADSVEQRLARQRAYDALGALAAALQRSVAEPASQRLPMPAATAVAALLDHGQRLMAHLSVVRLTLAERAVELAATPAADGALAQARAQLAATLATTPAAAAPQGTAAAHGLALVPAASPADDILPWLLRRLQLLAQDAAQARRAAASALAP